MKGLACVAMAQSLPNGLEFAALLYMLTLHMLTWTW
jgi:hypothetical protein